MCNPSWITYLLIGQDGTKDLGVVPALPAGEDFRHAGQDSLDVLGGFDTGFDRAGLVVFLVPVAGVDHILVAALVHDSDHLDAGTDLGSNVGVGPREVESAFVHMDEC